MSGRAERRNRRRWGLTVLGALMGTWASLSGCSNQTSPGDAATNALPKPPTAASLRILAGSELKELEPDIRAAAHDAGLNVEISYSGTLDMVDRINAAEPFDALLPPNG